MKIKQSNEYITLDKEQYIKNIVRRFEKIFKCALLYVCCCTKLDIALR